jgi:CheY-like chemotaxis protein
MSNLAFDSEHSSGPTELTDADPIEQFRPLPRISIQAFCETEGVARPIERSGEDRRMAKTHLKVHMGGLETALELYQTAPTPNLIILESRAEPRDMLNSLRQLADVCDPTTKVIVIGHYNDIWLYRELIRSGISEYVVAPISLADILSVTSSIFVNPAAEPLGRSIAFIGAKGGVGSSSIAHNVSWSISKLFKSEVMVADLDLPFGTANINFDQDPAQGIAEAVFSPERIDETYLDRLLAQCAEHLSLLAAPSTLDRTYDFEPDAFSSIIEIAQRNAPTVIPRRAACLERLDPQHAQPGRRNRHRCDAGTRQPAQHQEPRRHAEEDAAQRRSAETDHQPGRRAKEAGNRSSRFRRTSRHHANGGHSVRPARIRQRRQQWAHAGRNGSKEPDRRHDQRDRPHRDRPQRGQGQEEGAGVRADCSDG